jgi:hypothetical protein
MLERRKAERRKPRDLNVQDFARNFCRIADGQRVFVESVGIPEGGGQIRAKYQFLEGPHRGQSGNCLPSTLELLGKVIPVEESIEQIQLSEASETAFTS